MSDIHQAYNEDKFVHEIVNLSRSPNVSEMFIVLDGG